MKQDVILILQNYDFVDCQIFFDIVKSSLCSSSSLFKC